jgi:glutathione S-transferase
MPDDPYLRAEIVSRLFFEQADLQRAIALPRVYHLRGLVEQMSQRIAHFQCDGYSSTAPTRCCYARNKPKPTSG